MKEKKVFTPIRIGSMTLKNRIVLAALQTSLCHDGYPTEPFIALFEHLAKSGASMINVGGATISQDPPGLQFPSGPAVADDKLIPGLSRVADTIKLQGAKACLQIFHPGRGASTYAASRYGITPWSSSSTRPFIAAVDWKVTKEGDQWDVQQVLEPLPVRAITKEEIKQVVIMNVMGALRAMAAGFDAINLHFANVTLVMDFMSPYTNTRTDEYGGDWVGRMRLPCEILQAIRSAVGPYYPITVRIPVDQGVGEAGIQIDDVVKHIVPRLEEAGADAIDVSAGILDAAPDYIIPPMYYPRGLYMKHAEAIKKATKLPVLAVGRLCDPRLIERFIETDRCDVVQVCRPLLADPELPKKMMEDRYDDVRMCVACGYCASGLSMGFRCAINPELSRELTLPKLEAAEKRKKVLVVGSGPAGMEAARVLAIRGHDVTLCEKEKQLGGLLNIPSVKPLTREWRTFTRWHSKQIEKLGVKIELGKEVSPAIVEEMKPDAVVLATGSSPNKQVKGADQPIAVTEEDALLKRVEVGQKVVVLGGAFWDAETALSLADENKDVTLIRETNMLGPELGVSKLWPLLTRLLPEKGVKQLFELRVEKIEKNGVSVMDKENSIQFIEADTVVLSMGRVPEKTLAHALSGKVPELYEIGDCVTPRGVASSVLDGRVICGRI